MTDVAPNTGQLISLLRGLGPVCLAVLAAWWIGHQSRSSSLELPGFAANRGAAVRRALAWSGLALSLYLGVFLALGVLGVEINWSPPATPVSLFLVHVILILGLMLWFGVGLAGTPGAESVALLTRQLGLKAQRPGYELMLGAGVGLGIWAGVLACVVVFGVLLTAGGFESALPAGMPPMVEWIVAQPLWLRLAVSVSAGVVEELFFRGFLQPRIGLFGATVLFALAHLGYGEPFMLFGITLLSLSYGLLAKWRGSIFASIAAHAVFDAVQLLVLIPAAAAAAGAS